MNESILGKLSCRHCRYYRPEGRRGGDCQLFCGKVRGTWPACSFAIPPFAPTWETLENGKKRAPELLRG